MVDQIVLQLDIKAISVTFWLYIWIRAHETGGEEESHEGEGSCLVSDVVRVKLVARRLNGHHMLPNLVCLVLFFSNTLYLSSVTTIRGLLQEPEVHSLAGI